MPDKGFALLPDLQEGVKQLAPSKRGVLYFASGMRKALFLAGILAAAGCATLPPHGTPDVLELRFKADREKIFDALTEALYETGYPVATYAREEGILVTDYKPYSYSCCMKAWAFMGLGVRDPSIKLTCYVGKAPDDRNSVKIQGVIRFKGPRPFSDTYQERPLKMDTRYYSAIYKIAQLLETKVGESGSITEQQTGLESWW